MSGYLEVKYPFRSNLGLNPFKSWKRQWCILRPSPTCSGGGSLAVYCSEAGAAAGTVELPLGCVVRRAKSRTRPHAFAVFSVDEPRKPRILLAAQSLNDANIWMEKIRSLLNSTKLLGSESCLKDTYSVTVVVTDLSRKCGLNSDSNLTLSAAGLLVSRGPKLGTMLDWKHISDVILVNENADRNQTCVLVVDREFPSGPGQLKFSSPLSGELASELRRWLGSPRCQLSRSDGDLRKRMDSDSEVRRSSWYSGPSEVSLDDIDLVMSKDSKRPPSTLSRCAGAGSLHRGDVMPPRTSLASFDDSMSDRRSLLSVASGIYEEIPDLPPPTTTTTTTESEVTTTTSVPVVADLDTQYCAMTRPLIGVEEPTYESVGESVHCTARRVRRHPPPLPPRHDTVSKLESPWTRSTRHGSLGSLPRCCDNKTLPKYDKNKTFNVFRKRLKSDSRLISSPKSETAKENKDVEPKKKRFEFTPTRDIFKSFKVGRRMKNLKITSGSLTKGETKSCEFLDESEHVAPNSFKVGRRMKNLKITSGSLAKGEMKSCEFLDESEHVAPNRCSKSVECLSDTDDIDSLEAELSISLDPALLPQELLQLLVRGMNLPPRPAPPCTDHYMVMSPRNVAGV